MRKYIYGSVNWIHVFNLIKTNVELEKAKESIKKATSEGKKILFVATKLQARDAFSKLASETGHFYVTEKWVPGLLTNFKTIRKRISTYLKLLKDSENWALDILTKKEKAAKLLELEKLDKAFRWLKEMKKIPDVVFVIDGAFEVQALREANSLKIHSLAVLNTNWNPDRVEEFIPANTNSVKSIDYIALELKSCLSGVKVAAQAVPRKLTDRKPSINPVAKPTTEKSVTEKTEVKEAPVKPATPKPVAKKAEVSEAPAKPAVKKSVTKKAEVKEAPAKKPAVKKEDK